MREIIAVCRSQKKSRDKVAKVLDRYFWRIGDRTWRGKATNACLDRVSKELRKRAARNMAVVVHEIRSSSESRKPIIRIGSRHAFSEDGVVPVSSHPADFRKVSFGQADHDAKAAVVCIAALFHDLGKATNLFQEKLRRALKGASAEADAVRHELFSAAVWDNLFGQVADDKMGEAIINLTPDRIDGACHDVCKKIFKDWHRDDPKPLNFKFIGQIGALAHMIGMLILTHHRLPEGESDHITCLVSRHVRPQSPLDHDSLKIAVGTPFWHEAWWLNALKGEGGKLRPCHFTGADIALRAALMFADHLGSARKTAQDTIPDHLANTDKLPGIFKSVPADSLSCHVARVYRYARPAYDALYRRREHYPAIDEAALPSDIAFPEISQFPRFAWQGEAAKAARIMCREQEGGFFAAIMAGTGTGKTRAAPTILAGACLGDKLPERRYFRMCLGLGLRVLATQSAGEYVDFGFSDKDVAVFVGDPPLEFPDDTDDHQGSESLITLPEWLRIERSGYHVPEYGSDAELQWLRGLSLDTDRGLPAFMDKVLEKSGTQQSSGRRLLQTPVMVGTIDHLMGVASPITARFILQSVRMMTSDLILDEIDQYDGEDLAAIARLVFQAGAFGRRVIIMSATLTPDIVTALHSAYCRGWSDHAQAAGMVDHVNLLLCGDTPGSVFTNKDGGGLPDLIAHCQAKILESVRRAKPLRRADILPVCATWQELVGQVDQTCSRLHDLNAININGYRVSVGLVRMTRISHTTALAVQIRSGDLGNRLRLLVCFHARMPRLHRGYIETMLKRALTRKDLSDPNKGVKNLCLNEDVFARADQIGARDIEIVVVTTPVIETGNDVDFDWAILDPISTRSIIQSAGRVCRHREATGNHPNIAILGCSPVAMQGGKLAMPGVETKPHNDTRVPWTDPLKNFEGRHFKDLAGDADFTTITAEPLLRSDLRFPLRDAEAWLRGEMISIDQKKPLGIYISCPNARWNLAMTKSRKFRRSDTKEIEFRMIGDTLADAEWYRDSFPGTRNSVLRQPGSDLHEGLPDKRQEAPSKLFTDLTKGGQRALLGKEMTGSDIRDLFQVKIPCYKDDFEPILTYDEFTGFTWGTPEDLLAPFGKSI